MDGRRGESVGEEDWWVCGEGAGDTRIIIMQLQKIQSKIYEIQSQKVMLDFDLAELYEVETRKPGKLVLPLFVHLLPLSNLCFLTRS